MLVFPLKKVFFDKIANREKTIEYREVKKYWTVRLEHERCCAYEGKPYDYYELQKSVEGMIFATWCVFQLAYTSKRLYARVSKVEIVNGKDTDLKVDKPVYAIHFEDLGRVPKAF